jgi:hypothetical protein
VGDLSKYGMSPHQIYEYLTTGRGTGLLDAVQKATRHEWELETTLRFHHAKGSIKQAPLHRRTTQRGPATPTTTSPFGEDQAEAHTDVVCSATERANSAGDSMGVGL